MATCPTCLETFDTDVATCPHDGAVLVADDVLPPVGQGLAPGDVVGEYVVERQLGQGSFGNVYAAEHPVIGKRAAVKVLHARFSREPQVVSRFISEARAVNRIRHRNIIDVFSFGKLDNGQQYFIMELLDGETLGELLERRGALEVHEVCDILKGVSHALDAAHAEQITHRDLKPDNIFLSRERDGTIVPKLLDFGVAKLVDDQKQHKTSTGMALGTPIYMSPEQCRNRSVDHRADIYSLGVVAFQMLTGTIPFNGESVVDVLYKHIGSPPPDVSEMSTLPETMDPPLRQMLAKRPAQRPSSAGEALDLLASAACSSGFDVRPAGPRGAPTTREGYGAAVTRREDTLGAHHDSARGAATTPSPTASPTDVAQSEAHTMLDASPVSVLTRSTTLPSAADPALSRPSANGGETLSALETDSSRLPKTRLPRWWMAAPVLMVGLVGGYFALGHSPPVVTSNGVEAPPAAAPAPAFSESAPAQAPSLVVTTPPPAPMVRVTLQSSPADAEAWSGGTRLDMRAGVLELPRGKKPVRLTFKRAGYLDHSVEVTPRESQTIAFTLRRVPRRPAPWPAKRPTTPSPPPPPPPPPPPSPAPNDPRLEER